MGHRIGNLKSARYLQLLGLIISLVLLAACGQATNQPQTEPATENSSSEAATEAPDSTEGEGGEIRLWTEFTAGGEAAGIEELVERFNAGNNGGTVNHRAIGNEEFFTVIRTGLASGEAPDVLQYEGYQQTRDFAGAGQLTDLTEFWNQHKENFALSDAAVAACGYEGKIYCLPYTFQTGWQIYYNPQILEEHGIEVPSTMEDFLAAAETLKAAGVTPIALGNKNGWPGEHWWMAFAVQRCGVDTIYQAIEQEGVKFTDECFLQATQDFQSLAENGYFSAGAASDDYGAAQAVFLSGQAAFFQTGSWFASGWEQEPPPFEIGIMPFPRFSDAKNQTDVMGAVTHVFAIPTDAKNPEGAMAFLEFLASQEAGEIWAKNGNLSMVAGAVDNAAPAVIQDMWDKVKAASNSLPWIENELPAGVGEDKIYNGTVALINGSMTPEAFLDSVQQAVEASSK